MPLLTVDEAANELRIDRSTLYRHMSGPRPLKRVKIGRRTLFRRQDIDAFIESRLEPRRVGRI